VGLVPGGLGTRAEMANPRHIEFVQRQGGQAEWVTSVCTGALALHKAGFLEGKRATTHWGAIAELQNLGGDTTVVSNERWVHDGNVITAAGYQRGSICPLPDQPLEGPGDGPACAANDGILPEATRIRETPA
jgi:transcriptional regulator GlxA family with amidase domain